MTEARCREATFIQKSMPQYIHAIITRNIREKAKRPACRPGVRISKGPQAEV